MNLGRTGGPSTTTKPPSQSSTVKPTSVSGNLHAESKTEILHADTWDQCGVRNNTSWFDRENRATIYHNLTAKSIIYSQTN